MYFYFNPKYFSYQIDHKTDSNMYVGIQAFSLAFLTAVELDLKHKSYLINFIDQIVFKNWFYMVSSLYIFNLFQ